MFTLVRFSWFVWSGAKEKVIHLVLVHLRPFVKPNLQNRTNIKGFYGGYFVTELIKHPKQCCVKSVCFMCVHVMVFFTSYTAVTVTNRFTILMSKDQEESTIWKSRFMAVHYGYASNYIMQVFVSVI